MKRRRILELAVPGSVGLAGCASLRSSDSLDSAAENEDSESPSTDATASPQETPNTTFVHPDGAASNRGTRDEPLGSIQDALQEAKPGDTVHALPGRYHEVVKTVRPGKPDKPITITGPPDAVFIGGDETDNPEPLKIRHSHVQITGLTSDGLQNPNQPDNISSYARANITINPISRVSGDERPPTVSNVTITPHAVGNTLGPCIHLFFAETVEVGEFELIGPAGVAHFVFDEPGHDGEIVYIGTASRGWDQRWNGHVDRTRDVHLHHIDASAGHKHAELADAKLGTENVLVEYCTSVGSVGGQPAIHLGGKDGVARWNRIEESESVGILIGNWGGTDDRVPNGATENAVYGNRIRDSGVRSIAITDEVSAADQSHICGNDVQKGGPNQPEEACPEEVPDGNGVGHTGGDSPWK